MTLHAAKVGTPMELPTCEPPGHLASTRIPTLQVYGAGGRTSDSAFLTVPLDTILGGDTVRLGMRRAAQHRGSTGGVLGSVASAPTETYKKCKFLGLPLRPRRSAAYFNRGPAI